MMRVQPTTRKKLLFIYGVVFFAQFFHLAAYFGTGIVIGGLPDETRTEREDGYFLSRMSYGGERRYRQVGRFTYGTLRLWGKAQAYFSAVIVGLGLAACFLQESLQTEEDKASTTKTMQADAEASRR